MSFSFIFLLLSAAEGIAIKVITDKFSYKSGPTFVDFLGNQFRKRLLVSTAVATFGKFWAPF